MLFKENFISSDECPNMFPMKYSASELVVAALGRKDLLKVFK